MEEKKRSRLVLEKDDVELVERKLPSMEDKREADAVFGKILKNREPKK
jgi:hypothetical protein